MAEVGVWVVGGWGALSGEDSRWRMIKEELALGLSWGWKNQNSSSVFSLETRFLETSLGGWTSRESGLALGLSLRDNTGPNGLTVEFGRKNALGGYSGKG